MNGRPLRNLVDAESLSVVLAEGESEVGRGPPMSFLEGENGRGEDFILKLWGSEPVSDLGRKPVSSKGDLNNIGAPATREEPDFLTSNAG
jgi:hypothetical protein